MLTRSVDATGLPLDIARSGANRHDSMLVEPILDAMPAIKRGGRGHPRRRPVKLHGDKGYDNPRVRRYLRRRGVTARIARIGRDSSARLGRHRWVVERTIGWLLSYKRLALAAAVDRWSHTGRLYTSARDLPRMDTMPEDRIAAVIAGRHVRASGADLDRLRGVVDRAADLSTGLVDALRRAVGNGPAVRPHRVDRHNREAPGPGAAKRLLDRAQAVHRDTTTVRSPNQVARAAPPSR